MSHRRKVGEVARVDPGIEETDRTKCRERAEDLKCRCNGEPQRQKNAEGRLWICHLAKKRQRRPEDSGCCEPRPLRNDKVTGRALGRCNGDANAVPLGGYRLNSFGLRKTRRVKGQIFGPKLCK